MSHTVIFFRETAEIARRIDTDRIEEMARRLAELRARGGRLFIVGVGGSAANCSHAVNDFRKLCGIDAYTPVDNVSELTARTNDEGWATVFSEWLKISRMDRSDALMVLSVGGGDAERNVSANLVAAIDEAKRQETEIFAVVGRGDGYAARMADVPVIVPTVDPTRVTPHAEAFQAVVWHCLVSHPLLQVRSTKWEGLTAPEGEMTAEGTAA